MLVPEEIKHKISSIKSEDEFNALALELFKIQVKHNPIYRSFIESLPQKHRKPTSFLEIPFLPIDFFKSKRIIIKGNEAEIIFESSGSTGANTSKHYVADKGWYIDNSIRNFEFFYGDLSNYCVLALLPSYLERSGSSLVLMAEEMIKRSKHEKSGFYLDDFKALKNNLISLKKGATKTLLLGVSFALIDFAKEQAIHFPDLIVMETGGMKGRAREMIREELHAHLKEGFGVSTIHSEYGMTELLSQSYSKKDGIFATPPWMKFLIRDSNDPFTLLDEDQTGGLNIIDLANFQSCPFIATQDLARKTIRGTEILGRFDNSDIRGCNLLVI